MSSKINSLSWLYRLAAFFIRLILRLNGGIDIIGSENVPPDKGVIIASNHISYLDPPLIGAVSPRQITFMARKGLFTIPVIGWFINKYSFPVDRERTLPSTIKQSIIRLKRGEAVTMFPEGRRNETGEFLQAKRGLGMIVSMTGVPVVPVLIVGADKALPVGARWLKRAKLTVIFDKPVYFTSTIEKSDRHDHLLHEKISGRVMDEIAQMRKRYGDNNS